MAKRKSASSRGGRGTINPLDLPVAKALQGVVADVQKTTQSVVKEVQKRIPADWNQNVRRIQTRLDRTATQADLQKLARRVEDLTKQVERLASGRASSAASSTRARTRRASSTAAKTATSKTKTARRTARRSTSSKSGGGESSSSTS